MSTILGTVSLVSLGVAVFLAYQEGGEAAAGLGQIYNRHSGRKTAA